MAAALPINICCTWKIQRAIIRDRNSTRHLAWFETRLPPWLARSVGRLRKPSSRWLRIPTAMLLMIGGVFGFLPVLGLWMLPLGLILIAQDVPFLQRPLARLLSWIERKWMARRRGGDAQ